MGRDGWDAGHRCLVRFAYKRWSCCQGKSTACTLFWKFRSQIFVQKPRMIVSYWIKLISCVFYVAFLWLCAVFTAMAELPECFTHKGVRESRPNSHSEGQTLKLSVSAPPLPGWCNRMTQGEGSGRGMVSFYASICCAMCDLVYLMHSVHADRLVQSTFVEIK